MGWVVGTLVEMDCRGDGGSWWVWFRWTNDNVPGRWGFYTKNLNLSCIGSVAGVPVEMRHRGVW